jgi:hypothetical protein
VSLLRYPGLTGLAEQGLSVSQEGEVFTLTGSSLKKPIHVARYLDVVVAGTSAKLVAEAIRLPLTGGDESLWQAAPYDEHILKLPHRDEARRDFEVLLDVRALREKWKMTKPWPNPAEQSFLPAFLGRLFQVGSANRVFGVVEFDSGVNVDLRGEFSSELITSEQARFYRARSFDHKAIEEIARAGHEDTTFFAYLQGPIGTLLELAVQSMEPALRDNLTSLFVSTGGYRTLDQLITDLDAGMHDKAALFVRPNDWSYERDYKRDANGQVEMGADGKPVYDGPPFTPANVFAWTLVVWNENEQKLIDLRELIGTNGEKFGLQGRGPGDRGYYRYQISGNLQTREFWSRTIPGTGHIATINLPEHMMVSNRYMMLDDLTQNILQRRSRSGRLTDRADFMSLLGEMPPAGNVFIWANPRSGLEVLTAQAREAAERKVRDSIDLGQKRRELDAVVRRELVQGKPRNQLTADEQTRVDTELDRRVATYRDEVVAQNTSGALAEAERQTTYLGSLSGFMTLLNLDEKSFQLSVRAITPLTSEP